MGSGNMQVPVGLWAIDGQTDPSGQTIWDGRRVWSGSDGESIGKP